MRTFRLLMLCGLPFCMSFLSGVMAQTTSKAKPVVWRKLDNGIVAVGRDDTIQIVTSRSPLQELAAALNQHPLSITFRLSWHYSINRVGCTYWDQIFYRRSTKSMRVYRIAKWPGHREQDYSLWSGITNSKLKKAAQLQLRSSRDDGMFFRYDILESSPSVKIKKIR